MIVGDLIGAGSSLEWSVVSETTNLAARLQTLAQPDTVVTDDLTAISAAACLNMQRSVRRG